MRARPRETGTRACHVPTAARARTHSGHFGFSLSLSPFSSLFSFSYLSLSSLSSSLCFVLPFLHTQFCTHASPVFTDRRNRRRVYFYSPRIAMSDRSDLFSFSVQYYATIENVRSVSRVRGKRCHVQRLPTSMMQLAFNPHSRTLELNSTV